MDNNNSAPIGRIVVISAPSGCGKSTILHRLFDGGDLDMHFSVSATNRDPRPGEVNGQHYHFLTTEQFEQAIADDCFIEYEQVYPGRFYGTLRSEIDRRTASGENVVLDIDVNGALNVKRLYGSRALLLFVQPPSIAELRKRLDTRGTDTPEVIDGRVSRAAYEIEQGRFFDVSVVNDDLDRAVAETHDIIAAFLNNPQ